MAKVTLEMKDEQILNVVYGADVMTEDVKKPLMLIQLEWG